MKKAFQRTIFHCGAVYCLLLIATSTHAQDKGASDVVPLIIVAGQSNAVGYDAPPKDLPASPHDKEIMFWFRCGDPPPDEFDTNSGGQWTHLQAQPRGTPKLPKGGRQYGNFAQADGGFGPEMGLGRALYEKEKRKLAIIKIAFSGTGMRTDWNPKDPGDAGACYRALVNDTKKAVTLAKEKGVTLKPRAIAWVQGESDANARDAANYEQALGDMLNALRTDLEAPQLLALIAVNTNFGSGKNPFMPKIVEAQQALAQKNAATCVYVDTATATIANNAHFNGPGTLDVGQRFATALMKLEAK